MFKWVYKQGTKGGTLIRDLRGPLGASSGDTSVYRDYIRYT